MKRNVLFLGILLSALLRGMPAVSQENIPPVFEASGERFRKDIMTRTYLTAEKILWTSGEDAVTDSGLLLAGGTGQADIFGSGMCRMDSRNGKKPSLILDFGKEIHGGMKIVISAVSPLVTPVFRIRFGESVSEACSELKDPASPGGNTATNDHAVRDMVLTCPFYGQQEIGSTGFRFLRIDLLSEDLVVNLKEVCAVMRYRDIPYLGSFRCSDPRLEDIWMTGAYTVHLNMQEYVWDGIKRDRLVWLGDMHPETSTIAAVFGEDPSVYNSLDLATEQYPLPAYINGMSAYSLWYLIIQHDWYMQYGRKDFLLRHGDYIKGLVDIVDGKVDAQGNDKLGGGRFLDWPSSPNKEGVHGGYRALIVWAMKDAARLCRILGDEPRALKAEAVAGRIALKPFTTGGGLKQAECLGAIASLKDKGEAAKAILEGGAKGFSTFYGFYMLQALALDGKYSEAIDIIRKFWGGMLDLGATTFWEDFNLDWTGEAGRIDQFVPDGKKDIHGDFGAYCYPGFRHSFCHGWASGPTAWMSRYVLGIEPLAPGCAEVSVNPHLGDLEWAEGTYPTPKGVIHVRHVRLADGSIRTTVRAPKGIKIRRNKQ